MVYELIAYYNRESSLPPYLGTFLKYLTIFLAISFSVKFYNSRHNHCDLTIGQEYLVPINETEFAQAVSSVVKSGALPATRMQHAKSHGCVVAEFQVSDVIGSQYKQGAFKHPGKSYPAIVRFSNGARGGKKCLIITNIIDQN